MNWLFKHDPARWDGPDGPDVRWSVSSYLNEIRRGHNATMFLVGSGFVSIGLVTQPVYLGGGFDPAHALWPEDVVNDHYFVRLVLPYQFGPVSWSDVATVDHRGRTRAMGPLNPVPMSDEEWLRLLAAATVPLPVER